MFENKKSIRHIAIVGGGTAGWMSAIFLSKIYKNSEAKISLVESADIPSVGVGEATIPSFLSFLRDVGVQDKDLIKAAEGTIKLGIQFEDWCKFGESFFHPFGKIGRKIDGHNFYNVWRKLYDSGKAKPLMSYSPSAAMAEYNKFLPGQYFPNTPINDSGYALHIDANKAAGLFRNLSVENGVHHIKSTVKSVNLSDTGNIDSLVLENDEALSADFFIDCTGFSGLLIEDALHTGYENWQSYLPCDRAWVVQTASKSNTDFSPYTVSTAKEAGWIWRIPLQTRDGNGYVFSSQFTSENDARNVLLESIKGEPLAEPRLLSFTTGVRKKVWNKNCLSVGLSSGFIEPLESTALHLIYKTLMLFVRHFPSESTHDTSRDLFNREIKDEFLEIRDFIIMHYCTTKRSDSSFWRWCQTMAIPDTLSERLRIFSETAYLRSKNDEVFLESSWLSVLEGMGIRSRVYHPLVDLLDENRLQASLAGGNKALMSYVESMPTHGEFLHKLLEEK